MTARPKVDFAKIDCEQGWHRPEGAPEGVSVKILAGALDHVPQQGHCTTLTRWRAGTEVTQAITHDYQAITHDYIEEVYVIFGALQWLGADGAMAVEANSYVCRSADVPHGPFRADEDYLATEFCYYADAGR